MRSTLVPGPSTPNGGSDWECLATSTLTAGQAVTIEVTATDRPGHKVTKTKAKA